MCSLPALRSARPEASTRSPISPAAATRTTCRACCPTASPSHSISAPSAATRVLLAGRAGGLDEGEMLRTFNCGIGMIAIVKADAIAQVTEVLTEGGETVALLGRGDRGRGRASRRLQRPPRPARNEAPHCHPDFRARVQHDRADRCGEGGRISRRDRRRDFQQRRCAGLRAARPRAACRPSIIESKPFGKDRAGFERCCSERSSSTISN